EERSQGPVVRLRPQLEVSKQCRTAFRHSESSEVETKEGVVSINGRSVECRGTVACPGTGPGPFARGDRPFDTRHFSYGERQPLAGTAVTASRSVDEGFDTASTLLGDPGGG